MYRKFFLIIILFIFTTECSKKEVISNKPPDDKESDKIYEEAISTTNHAGTESMAEPKPIAWNIISEC